MSGCTSDIGAAVSRHLPEMLCVIQGIEKKKNLFALRHPSEHLLLIKTTTVHSEELDLTCHSLL